MNTAILYIKSLFRPNLSVRYPPRMAPAMAPMLAAATEMPSMTPAGWRSALKKSRTKPNDVIPFSIIIIFMNYSGPMAYNAVLNSFISTSLRGVGNGWNYTFNKITEAVSGLTGGTILVLVGLKFNTIILFIIVAAFTVIAVYTGKSKYFKKGYASDLQTSPEE